MSDTGLIKDLFLRVSLLMLSFWEEGPTKEEFDGSRVGDPCNLVQTNSKSHSLHSSKGRHQDPPPSTQVQCM